MKKKEFADWNGVSVSQVEAWHKEGLPRTKRGRANWYGQEHQQWVNDRLRQRQPKSYDEAKARKEAALAEMAELDLAIKRGQVMPISQHLEMQVRLASTVRGKLLNAPGRYTPLLVGKRENAEILAILEGMMREILVELPNGNHKPVGRARKQPARRRPRKRTSR